MSAASALRSDSLPTSSFRCSSTNRAPPRSLSSASAGGAQRWWKNAMSFVLTRKTSSIKTYSKTDTTWRRHVAIDYNPENCVVSVGVSDYDRALAWYRDVLGFELHYELPDTAGAS